MTQWRSLEEREQQLEAEAEFPSHAPWLGKMGRRNFLKLLGGTAALAGLTSCRAVNPEKLTPFVHQPPGQMAGVSRLYASSFSVAGYARPVLVETVDGRPIKLEGHPQHPSVRGALDSRSQAELMEFYSPRRKATPTFRGKLAPLDEVTRFLAELPDDGEGVHLLTRTITSPTVLAQIASLQKRRPNLRWHRYQPDALLRYEGKLLDYDFAQCEFVLSFDADPFVNHPESLRYIREYSAVDPQTVVVESTPSLLGGRADHRIGLPPDRLEGYLESLAAKFGLDVQAQPGDHPNLDLLVEQLQSRPSVVLVGSHLSPRARALGFAINQRIGSQALRFWNDPDPHPLSHMESMAELVSALKDGDVMTLLILDGNPALDAPGEFDFPRALERAGQALHLCTFANETSRACDWFLPMTHPLEKWGDLKDLQGRVVFQQPTIEPLYQGLSESDVLGLLSDESLDGYSRLKSRYDEKAWRQGLSRGYLDREAPAQDAPAPQISRWGQSGDGGAFLVLKADSDFDNTGDRHNPWLEELPESHTKQVWGRAALVAPSTAEQYQLEDGQYVRFVTERGEVEFPVVVTPGQAAYTFTIPLGHRSLEGFKLYQGHPEVIAGVVVEPLERFENIVTTQSHHRMEGRDLVRTELPEQEEPPESLFHFKGTSEEQWGMTIDLTKCVGCNACVTACQAENNVPVVGKQEVARGREMHWLRVDRYYEGHPDNPRTLFQPVTCMHCENAPCEPVCPVGATNHSQDGLNQMIYNRCIGTRYCSNACPYKVRRFNFFEYNNPETDVEKMRQNPEVTVRSRGVMEKCTYCTQRISAARIEAKNEDRDLRDGDVITACQAACPAQAITFGDISDPRSAVSQTRQDKRHYALLAEQNTRPRTTYLADIRNPLPGWREPE